MKVDAGQTSQTATKKIPFKPNLLEEVDGKPRMTGSRCPNCGKTAFPFRPICIFCHARQVEKTYLSPRGRLHTYTICRVPVPNTTPPYAMGMIDLPEGLTVFAQLTGWREKELKVGMEMEMVQEKLKTDKEGNEVYTYKFRPAGEHE